MKLTTAAKKHPRRLHPGWPALLLAALLTACDTGPSAEDDYKQGVNQFKAGDLRAVVIHLKNALGKNPDFADARELLARTYIGMGNGELAEKEFGRARELGYSGNDVEEGLINAILMQGRFEEVEERVKKAAVQLNPAAALVLRGAAEFGLQKLADASRSFEQALELEPTFLGARRGLAEIAMVNGDFDEANRQLDLALEIAGDDPQTWMMKSRLETRLERYEDALEALEPVLAKYPDSVKALTETARLQLLLNRPAEARARLDDLAKLYRDSPPPEVQHLRAVTAFVESDHRAAEEILRDILGRVPNYVPSLYLIGTILYQKGDFNQAAEYLRRLNAEVPNNSEGRVLLAAVHLNLNEVDKAILDLEEALRLNPNNVMVLGLLGHAHLAQQNVDSAFRYLKAAAKLAPETGTLRMELARAMLGKGDVDGALAQLHAAADSTEFYPASHLLILTQVQLGKTDEAFEAARTFTESHPEDAIGWNLLGITHLLKGDSESARASYEKALSVEPAYSAAQLNLARLDLRAGDKAAARKRYEAMLARRDIDGPEYASAAVALARIDLVEGNVDAARKHYAAALERDPTNTEALVNLAGDTGNPADAAAMVEKLETARALDPAALEPRLLLATHYIRAPAAEKALEVAQEAVAIAPQMDAALLLLALAQGANGRIDDALRSSQRSAQLFPDSASSHYEVARWALRKGDVELGRESLQAGLRIEPENIQTMIAIAVLDLSQRSYDRVLETARRIQTLNPDDVRGYNLEAEAYLAQNKNAEAVELLEKTNQLAPGTEQVTRLFGAKWRAGDQAGAVQALEQWLRGNPQDTVVLSLAANATQQQGRNDVASGYYRRVLERAPADTLALNNLAWVLHLQGKTEESLDFAKKAFDLLPSNPDIADTYGWLMVLADKPQQAVTVLNSASQAAESNPTIRYHLAYALWKTGQRDGALREVRTALDSGLDFAERQEATMLRNTLEGTP